MWFSGGTLRGLLGCSCSSCVYSTPGTVFSVLFDGFFFIFFFSYSTVGTNSFFSSFCVSAFVIHQMLKWTSWLWPVMSQLWLKMGLRWTTLRKTAVQTELWTMKRTESPTPTLSSTSCFSWHHSTSWWRWPTGTGTVKPTVTQWS